MNACGVVGCVAVVSAFFLAACAGAPTAAPTAPSSITKWVATALRGDANETWAIGVSVSEYNANVTALLACERRTGAQCASRTACAFRPATWAGLSRVLVNETYQYRLVCDRGSSADAQRALAIAGGEVVWGPTVIR